MNIAVTKDQEGPSRPSSSAKERYERIYGALRERICLLDYPPGTRLSEEELAAEFATSRTPIRRVLARLESEGLIEARHGVGTIVTDVEMDEVEQVYALRLELATLIGRLSPLARTEADLDRIRELIRRCDEHGQEIDHRSLAKINMDFFAEISAIIGNIPLREISERLYFQIARIVLKAMPRLNLAEELAAFQREMKDVLAALEINDLDAVGHIRRAHISMSFTRIMRYAGRL